MRKEALEDRNRERQRNKLRASDTEWHKELEKKVKHLWVER
jgi:hypothetical protein